MINNILVIIVTFNSEKSILGCINSLVTQTNNILIIDNHSSDKTIELLEKYYSKITLIRNVSNIGFSRAVNIGLKYAQNKYKYVLLLNPDTTVSKLLLETLRKYLMKRNNVGIISPSIQFTRNQKLLFDIGGKIDPLFGRAIHIEVDNLPNTVTYTRDFVSGCCMMIKTEVIRNIGMFDDKYFMYYEDVDYCLRAKEMNYLVKTTTNVNIKHQQRGSTSGLNESLVYNLAKSTVIFGKQYFKGFRLISNILWWFLLIILFTRNNYRFFMPGIIGVFQGLIL